MLSTNQSAVSKKTQNLLITVGISGSAVTDNHEVTLITHSLGSCIGVAVYDPKVKVGGLLHYMLPDASIDPVKAKEIPSMFGNTGIPTLINELCAMRGEKDRLIITVAGGAQIIDTGKFFNIGRRNYEVAKIFFEKNNYKVFAEHVGGMFSRTMSLDLRTGEVRLKISGKLEDIVLCRLQ